MRFKLTIVLSVLFLFGFLFSLVLGLLASLPVGTVFLRAVFLGFFFVAVGLLIGFIYKNYLASTFNLADIFSSFRSDSQDTSVPFEGLQGEDIIDPIEISSDEGKDTAHSSQELQNRSTDPQGLDFPSFLQSQGKGVSQDESEGLTKITKDSFQEEDPSLMAEAIRTVIAKGQDDKTSKTKRSE